MTTNGTGTELPQTHLSSALTGFLDGLDGSDCSVAELIAIHGDRGFGLLLLVLALPAALPIPAPGYATPFGVLMMALGFQMVRGRGTPWVPDFAADRTISYRMLEFSVRNGRIPLRAVELLVKPRLSAMARNRRFLAGVGVTIMVMSAFMSLPIPLTNTAPSFVIFVLAAGILEEDGLLLLGGLLLAPVAAAIAGSALYVAATLGPAAVETTVKPMLKGLFGA
ncbi:MAG: exopolysaccharide biosynthesis protein [Myxococcota bacterium]|nr:exopolysaccharide biosynthesis protein [Myxococcota bacterium]